MRNPILTVNRTDDDRPSRPDPLEDSLTSAQCRRYQKLLLEEDDNFNYSD